MVSFSGQQPAQECIVPKSLCAVRSIGGRRGSIFIPSKVVTGTENTAAWPRDPDANNQAQSI